MARGKRTRSTPAPSDLITQAEAAVYFDVTPPMITRWKSSGEYEGFYPGGVYLPELIRSYGKNERDKGRSESDDDEVDPAVRASVIAKAKGTILKYQIEAGKTAFVDDIVMAFELISQEFRDSTRRIAPTLATDLTAWLAETLPAAADPIDRDAVMRALTKIDQRAFTLAIDDRVDRDLGRIGVRVGDVIATALEKSRLS